MGWTSKVLREGKGIQSERKSVENVPAPAPKTEYFKDKKIELNNGTYMPSIIFGTWRMWYRDDRGYAPVFNAIKHGCRAIDTAQAYNTEIGVGRAIKDSRIDRRELFISTKFDPDKVYDYASAQRAFDRSLKNLQTPYIDIMYIHAPSNWDRTQKHDNVSIYMLLEDKVRSGEIRGIGISNFSASELKEILEVASIRPAVVQLPGAIGYQEEKELIDICKEYGITIVPYSPLASGYLLDEPFVKKVAQIKGVTKAQACLAYAGQKYGCFVFGSENDAHIKENMQTKANIFSREEVEKIDAIDKDVRMWDYKKMWLKDLRQKDAGKKADKETGRE